MASHITTKILTKNILVNADNQILALKRSETDDRRPNCWDFPGGGKDEGEDIYVSAKREILEEVGVDIEEKDLKVIYVESGMGVTEFDILALCFIAKKYSGQIKISAEHVEHKWVTPEDFLEMETGNDGGFLHNCVRTYIDILRDSG